MEKIELMNAHDLEQKLIDNIKQKKLPDYLLYIGNDGANNWLELDGSEAFPIAKRLTGLIQNHAQAITRWIDKPITLVSIGVGNGEKERILIESAPEKIKNYYPVDISSDLVDRALERVDNIPIVKTGLVGLFETLAQMRTYWKPPIMLCLLGNNFSNYEAHDVFETVYNNVEPGDFFLFDSHLFTQQDSGTNIDAIEKAYRSPQNVQFNTGPLNQFGISKDAYEFVLDLVLTNAPFGAAYKTQKKLCFNKECTLSAGETEVQFKPGDCIEMGFTYKYTAEQIENIVASWNFDICEKHQSEDRSNVLILVQKKV